MCVASSPPSKGKSKNAPTPPGCPGFSLGFLRSVLPPLSPRETARVYLFLSARVSALSALYLAFPPSLGSDFLFSDIF